MDARLLGGILRDKFRAGLSSISDAQLNHTAMFTIVGIKPVDYNKGMKLTRHHIARGWKISGGVQEAALHPMGPRPRQGIPHPQGPPWRTGTEAPTQAGPGGGSGPHSGLGLRRGTRDQAPAATQPAPLGQVPVPPPQPWVSAR